MKTVAILIVLLAIAGTSLFFQENQSSQEAVAYSKFIDWKQKFNKVFSSEEEDSYRFLVFLKNHQYVQEFNSKNTFELGVENQFAALTNEEYKAIYTSNFIRANNQVENEKNDQQLISAPSGSVNWVSKGAVYSVQNQGQCGSCWAFSAVCSLEGLYKINTGKLIDFSEQQVVSCEPKSFGCKQNLILKKRNKKALKIFFYQQIFYFIKFFPQFFSGGYPEAAFAYVASKGLETAASYPYVQTSNTKTAACNYNSSKATFGINKSYKKIAANNPDAIHTQLLKQPLSILVDASSSVFQLYKGGIINSSSCGTDLDHAINVVGYDNGVWTLRNSWGTSWGEKGYARVQYSSGAGYCGMNKSASYPTN
ncbi:hypothetical protein PPERSA_07821 [Pseudocohnilembus persalinus]|uniref:Papain family cysteine protease n=1 Tax=Pseudocohnilembus persalinus TaxID=266149 RepID=A0A0V0QC23_PSEPJ|nr:hypothetical protein PPERSA_07821 [Pseudocohnilembus persalinus]|eukprot:KRW99744.1 hypothetical protein PPERSA_07821 [Pseudocohnilembus persalinus]